MPQKKLSFVSSVTISGHLASPISCITDFEVTKEQLLFLFGHWSIRAYTVFDVWLVLGCLASSQDYSFRFFVVLQDLCLTW